jgi:hypothetical protein
MQFNRTEDGVMHKLPKPSVDTGMGLERLAAVLQHVHSNYEIDIFVALLAAAKKAVEVAGGGAVDAASPSLKVIADHIRACSFTVGDGVIPGNEGRGYVLRRIARRGIRHGYKLGARKPFFHTLVAAVAQQMGDAYPDLRRDAERVTAVLKAEEERFFQTIANGMDILETALANGTKTLAGDIAFKLHDTFGFPLDLTADVCRERGVVVDEAGFEQAMKRQREQARAAAKFKLAAGLAYTGGDTQFHGYDGCTTTPAPWSPSTSRARRLRTRTRATTWWLCSTTRRSTPKAAARSATPASCATPRRESSWKTRSRSPPLRTATRAASSKAGSRWATASSLASTSSAARRPCATTAPRTSCTRPCAKCWGRTCSRRVRS